MKELMTLCGTILALAFMLITARLQKPVPELPAELAERLDRLERRLQPPVEYGPLTMPLQVANILMAMHDADSRWWKQWGITPSFTRQGTVWISGGPHAYNFGFAAKRN